MVASNHVTSPLYTAPFDGTQGPQRHDNHKLGGQPTRPSPSPTAITTSHSISRVVHALHATLHHPPSQIEAVALISRSVSQCHHTPHLPPRAAQCLRPSTPLLRGVPLHNTHPPTILYTHTRHPQASSSSSSSSSIARMPSVHTAGQHKQALSHLPAHAAWPQGRRQAGSPGRGEPRHTAKYRAIARLTTWRNKEIQKKRASTNNKCVKIVSKAHISLLPVTPLPPTHSPLASASDGAHTRHTSSQ